MNIKQSTRTVIADVVAGSHRGWIVTDAAGVIYRTFNPWIAALAAKYQTAAVPVDVRFTHGWLHRDLTGIVPASEPQTQPIARICSYCNLVMSEGTRPGSHGICPACQTQLNAELDAKYGAKR